MQDDRQNAKMKQSSPAHCTLQEPNMTEKDEVAIVGVGCKFPGADNIDEYWRVLKNGENHVKQIPRDRWNNEAFYDPDRNVPGKTYVRTAGFVNSIDEWDHRFYGVNDMEAALVDPQQRIVLDCVHMALEDGGITKNDIKETQTGVYIGSMNDDYKGQVIDRTILRSAYSVTGTQNSIISARVSYTYNLLGPAMTIDTACSSSLVAIDVASQAIQTGKCSMAICGGVNILLDPELFVALSKAGMLSPTGQCKTFTKYADGYARGEGCGIVLLKSLKDAVKDGNKIWGTIKTGTNQDGHMATPIMAPSGLQQERLIKEIYKRYNVDKAKINVIEAHGTGTAIGDPTEANALGSHFGLNAKAPGDVFIGSVKTNIGHLEAAAGVAGIIKVLLMMKHGLIAPSLWYTKDNENPYLKLEEKGFIVPTQCTPWTLTGGKTRLACVNSFGFGGTNAHAIIEEHEDPGKNQTPFASSPLPNIIAVSAFDHTSLVENLQTMYQALNSQEYNMGSLSYTSLCRRDHRTQRKAVFGKSQKDILASLNASIKLSEDDGLPTQTRKITYVFCGVGTAWQGMCSTLMNLDFFKQAVESIDKYLQPLAGWTISKKFLESSDILSDPMISHIAIFACQVGLCAFFEKLNIRPDCVIGQSVGEVAAAYAAGYVDLQTAVEIIFHRSQFLSKVKSGTMAVIRNVDTSIVEAYCKSCLSVTVAVYSSPKSCTVSGNAQDISKLKKDLVSIENVDPEIIDLDVKCAYHSEFVDKAARQLALELDTIQYSKGHTPFISTVTGQIETEISLCTSKYWEKNVRMPVLLSSAVKFLDSKSTENIFIEIGPSPVLRAHIGYILTENTKYQIIPSMQKENEINTLADALCKLFDLGRDLEWNKLFPYQCQMTDIPRYQFRKYRQLFQSQDTVKKNQGVKSSIVNHMYIKQLPQKKDGVHYKVDIDETSTPFVSQHVVSGSIILPGAVYADIGFEIAENVQGIPKKKAEVSLEFIRPVRIAKGSKTMLHITIAEQNNELLFHAKHNQVTVCKGWVRSAEIDQDFPVNIERLQLSISNEDYRIMSMDDIYNNLAFLGFRYGPYFQLMTNCITNGTESLSELHVSDVILKESETTTLHPSVLDAMMQSVTNIYTKDILSKIKEENLSFLPVAIGKLRVLKKPEKHMFVYTKKINVTLLETVLQVHCNVLLISSGGSVVAELKNFTTYSKRNASKAPCELKYRLTWHPFNNDLLSKEKPVDLLILTSRYIKDLENDFPGLNNVTIIQNTENISYDDYIANAFEKTVRADKGRGTDKEKVPENDDIDNDRGIVDAVIFLVEDFGYVSDMTSTVASNIQKSVKDNCMLVAKLVRYMKTSGIPCPLYIATQNSQPTFTTLHSSKINLVGAELWGFVKSIGMELIYGEITLIDLQPSIKETQETLLQFINDTCRNIKNTKPDIIIHFNKVFGAQFSKVPRYEVIPSLRKETKIGEKLSTPQKVLALRSQSIGSLLLSPVTDIEENQKKGCIQLHVKSVYIHPLSIYPVTTSGISLDQDIWPETIKGGHNLFGLEFIGTQVSSISISENKVENDYRNGFELLCIQPREITTEMFVPKNCTVNLMDIPFYRPGLILYATLCWRLAELVPDRSRVVIYSRNPFSEAHLIFERILRNEKDACIFESTNGKCDNSTLIDILITLEKIDSSLVLLRRCKKIICLETSVSDSLRIKMLRSENQTLVCHCAAELLEERYVSKCLKKVVSWIQNNFQKLTDHYASLSNDTDSSKTVINNGKTVIPTRNPIDKLFSKTAVYVVTGGLTGLGWEIVLLLAEMGAGVIATMSRRNVTCETRENISRAEEAFGCKIICVQGDVTDLSSVQAAFKEIKDLTTCPVRGVFHGAGVLMPKLLMYLKEADLDYVLQPKVIGTLNMQIATKEMDLDYFVVHSSINSLIGSPGQSNYGAANSFLDTFIEWRRRQGLAGQAINWGALSVGMASKPAFVENFSKRGFNLLSRFEIRSCFQEVLMNNSTGIVYTDVNWDICAKDYTNPGLGRSRLQMFLLFEEEMSHVLNYDNDGLDNTSFDKNALQMAGNERQKLAIAKIIKKISGRVIGGDLDHVNMSSAISELSFDSMATVTFINAVHDIIGYRISTSFMADTSHTLDDVVHLLQEELFNRKDFTSDDP